MSGGREGVWRAENPVHHLGNFGMIRIPNCIRRVVTEQSGQPFYQAPFTLPGELVEVPLVVNSGLLEECLIGSEAATQVPSSRASSPEQGSPSKGAV